MESQIFKVLLLYRCSSYEWLVQMTRWVTWHDYRRSWRYMLKRTEAVTLATPAHRCYCDQLSKYFSFIVTLARKLPSRYELLGKYIDILHIDSSSSLPPPNLRNCFSRGCGRFQKKRPFPHIMRIFPLFSREPAWRDSAYPNFALNLFFE